MADADSLANDRNDVVARNPCAGRVGFESARNPGRVSRQRDGSDAHRRGQLHQSRLPNGDVLRHSKIPANAWVMSATVKVKGCHRQKPFLTHRSLVTDIRKPLLAVPRHLLRRIFRQSPVGQQWARSRPRQRLAGTALRCPTPPTSGSTSGTTQFRLRFLNSTDGDGIADTVSFYSGNVVTPANRPVLEVGTWFPSGSMVPARLSPSNRHLVGGQGLPQSRLPSI